MKRIHVSKAIELRRESQFLGDVDVVSRSLYYLFLPSAFAESPKIGQYVRIEGQPGIYIVLRLDKMRFAADLMLTTGKHELEENVPYFAIEPIDETHVDVFAIRRDPVSNAE